MAIIGILASLMLAPMGKALRKARGVAGFGQAADSITPIFEEIQQKYSAYRMANPNHERLDLKSFVSVCSLSAKTEAWLRLNPITFVTFSGNTPADTIIIQAVPSATTGQGGLAWRIVDLLKQ
jgi:hypothetical protein